MIARPPAWRKCARIACRDPSERSVSVRPRANRSLPTSRPPLSRLPPSRCPAGGTPSSRIPGIDRVPDSWAPPVPTERAPDHATEVIPQRRIPSPRPGNGFRLRLPAPCLPGRPHRRAQARPASSRWPSWPAWSPACSAVLWAPRCRTASAGHDHRIGEFATPVVVGCRRCSQKGSVAAIADATLPTVVSLSVSGNGGEATGSGFVIRDDGYIPDEQPRDLRRGQWRSDRRVVQRREPSQGQHRRPQRLVRPGRREGRPHRIGAGSAGQLTRGAGGRPVIAIGSPLGLNGTVTTGIISALNRPVTAGGQGEQSFISALQTDAAINPGTPAARCWTPKAR